MLAPFVKFNFQRLNIKAWINYHAIINMCAYFFSCTLLHIGIIYFPNIHYASIYLFSIVDLFRFPQIQVIYYLIISLIRATK